MKLHQVVALVKGKKNSVDKKITEIYHQIQKPDTFNGFYRTYQPLDDEGEKFPDEKKNVQYSVADSIEDFSSTLTDLFNLIGTQDKSNCLAKTDLKVDGQIILSDVPVTYLMFLESQAINIQTFINKMPTLDPAEIWSIDQNSGNYRNEPVKTSKTKKVLKNHIKAEATDKHPAQVDVHTEDVRIGEWTTTKFSGAIPATERNRYLQKIQKLIEAIRIAREEANIIDVVDFKDGEKIFDFVFK